MASNYISLPPQGGGGGGAVDSVNGLTGVVVLTKSNIGLSNVDNTSDLNKPISTATQTALNAKQATITGAASTVVSSNLTADRAVVSNGSGKIDTVGVTSGEVLYLAGATSNIQTQINAKADSIGGANSKLVYKNDAGVVESLGSRSVNTDASLNAFVAFDLDTGGNKTGEVTTYQANATENAPNSNFQADYLQIDIDANNDGFNLGTNGTGITGRSINVQHNGESDVGSISLNSSNFSLGNGTDPIDINGIAYNFGFGAVNANVNISGPIQGYGFQPNINSAATIDSTEYTQAFYDAADINCDSPSYTSFNASPTIDTINNNSNYTGVNITPTIDNFTGNAGVTGLNVSPTLGTFNQNGYLNAINVNPTVASARYAAGINVTMDNVTPYAGAVSTLTEQDLTLTFNTVGDNNNYTLEYTAGATAGSEVVSLVGTDISVQIEDGVSTATQIKAAMDAVPQLVAAITITISGTGSNPQDIFGPANFTGGENAGNVVAAFLDGNVEITGSLTFGGALSIGQLNAFASQAVVSGSGNPVSIHNLISQPTVGNNQTITLGDTIGVNTAMLLTVGTNSTVTSALVGLSALALPAVVNLGAGSTVDRVAGATFAISLDAGAAGTISNLDLCRAVGLPNGTTTVTRLKGYAMDLPFGDPGTTTWGFYESPGVNNYFAGNLLIGGTAGSDDTVTNSSVALEIKSTAKAFLNARMTTTERNALTAINGMQIYNTTTDKLQVYAAGSWVDLH